MAEAFLRGETTPGYESKLRTLGVKTGPAYKRVADKFIQWCLHNGKEVELQTLLLYLHCLHDCGTRASTLFSMTTALRHFFKYGVINPNGRPYDIKDDIPEVDMALKQWQRQENQKQSKVNL